MSSWKRLHWGGDSYHTLKDRTRNEAVSSPSMSGLRAAILYLTCASYTSQCSQSHKNMEIARSPLEKQTQGSGLCFLVFIPQANLGGRLCAVHFEVWLWNLSCGMWWRWRTSLVDLTQRSILCDHGCSLCSCLPDRSWLGWPQALSQSGPLSVGFQGTVPNSPHVHPSQLDFVRVRSILVNQWVWVWAWAVITMSCKMYC
jgi:hypothetical protein